MKKDGCENFDILDGVLLCAFDCGENVTVKEGVIGIEEEAFLGIENLKRLTLPESLKTIGKRAFAKCINLREISFADGTVGIERSAFENCASLESITLPRSLIILGENAFKGARNLKVVSIHEEIIIIRDGAFADCPRLKRIVYSGTKSLWSMVEKGENWDSDIGEYVVECSDGEIKIIST